MLLLLLLLVVVVQLLLWSGRFDENEFFVIAVGSFRPEAPCLEDEYAGEGDAAEEVVGSEFEGGLT